MSKCKYMIVRNKYLYVHVSMWVSKLVCALALLPLCVPPASDMPHDDLRGRGHHTVATPPYGVVGSCGPELRDRFFQALAHNCF